MELRASFYNRRCLVCKTTPSDPAHVKSYASGGPDAEFNLIPLCRKCHTEQHKIGQMTFIHKYLAVYFELQLKGWEIHKNKLFHVELQRGRNNV